MKLFLNLKPALRSQFLFLLLFGVAIPLYSQPTLRMPFCGTRHDSFLFQNAEAKGLSVLSQTELPSADTLLTPVIVDVMFLYTPQAIIGAGSEDIIRQRVYESIEETNYRFTNSLINVSIKPVFIGKINYSESGSMETDLTRLANGEGSFSRAVTLRNDYKADIVVLITELENLGIGGYAWEIPLARGNASGAFLAMRRAGIGGFGKGSMVLAHELGHLFGCAHDREHVGDLNAPWLRQRRPYIFGHRFEVEGVTYVDVMSYEPGIYVPYFSNPRLNIDGVPLGVAEGERPSDTARTINETASYVARYRDAISRIEFDAASYALNEREGKATVTLRRSGNLNTSTRTTIVIETDSTAMAIDDYFRPTSMTVSFETNQAMATLEIPIVVDQVQEGRETLHLSLRSPTGSHGIGWQGETMIEIHDTQPAVTFLKGPIIVQEQDGTIEIPLTLNVHPEGQINPEITWHIVGNSSDAGTDLEPTHGVIQLKRNGMEFQSLHSPLQGEASATYDVSPIQIKTFDNNRPEADRVFKLIISGITNDNGVVYGAVTNDLRIADDDRLGAFQLALRDDIAVEGGMNVAVRHDGRFLVWGGFTPGRAMNCLDIALLNKDGSISPEFRPPEFLAGHRRMDRIGNAQVGAVQVLPDGKILLAGQFSRVAGQIRTTLVRLNADGSLDTTFGRDLAFDGSVLELILQPDGKILVGGSFEKINGKRRAFIARLNADGSVDESFNPGAGPSSTWTVHVYAMAIQRDGKILVGGYFEKFDGNAALNFARLHADGKFDSSFKLKNVSGPVTRIQLQTDGKIFMSGLFETAGGRASRKLARVNSDGSADLSFKPPLPNSEVREMNALPDGRLLVSGSFTSIANSNRRFVALLNSDGTIDHEFNLGAGPNDLLGPIGSLVSRSMTLHADGGLYLSGQFKTINGLSAGDIVKIKFGEVAPSISEAMLDRSGEFSITANVLPGGTYSLEATTDFKEWSIIGELRAEGFERKRTMNFWPTSKSQFYRLKHSQFNQLKR